MSIQYTYEIVAVNEAARVMEVVYTAEGHPTQHISARLPYVGESLERVIHMYSPVVLWDERTKEVFVPEVGVSGQIDPSTPAKVLELQETDEQKQERLNLEMWKQVEFEKEVAKVLVKFGVLQSNPTTIEVTQI